MVHFSRILAAAVAVSAGVSAATFGAEENRVNRRLATPLNTDTSDVDLAYQSLSRHPVEAWAEIIDATWGAGAPTHEKIALFDAAWQALDFGYGAFVNLDVDMAELRHRYRSELEGGVSRGRFVAIMNHLSLAMKDLHTVLFNREVNRTRIRPGVPMMIVRGWLQNAYFGASLTPLADGSLVVLRACPNHPLGLERGDIVLGYDGIPWGELYRLLLEQELPIELGAAWGSTDEAMDHAMLISVGQNWHLFDTIDVIDRDTGETLHLSTNLLAVARSRAPGCSIWGNEQLPVPGVPMVDFDARDYVSWGLVEGTRIGYIYVASWDPDPELEIRQQFHDAIESLMDTEGLIIDYRLNTGGYMPVAHLGYSLLFDNEIEAVSFDVRGDSRDHLAMVPHPTFTSEKFTIQGDPASVYDQPIAVLTGPGAFSNGDWETLRTRFHPRARVFGKPTNGAFTPSDNPSLLGTEWHFSRGTGSGYLIDGHVYLAHTGAPVDEEVWFTAEDVANGRDTVVAAAVAWILQETN